MIGHVYYKGKFATVDVGRCSIDPDEQGTSSRPTDNRGFRDFGHLTLDQASVM
jgi:hypothetical protein